MEMDGAVFILWPTMKHYGWISGHRMNGEYAIFILWPIDGKDPLLLSQARASGPCRRHEGVRGMCPRGKKAAGPPTIKKPRVSLDTRGSKVAATYSPTWCSSTIGARELNFSVRNGKRWILTAITAFHISPGERTLSLKPLATVLLASSEVFGILVPIDFDIAAFTSSAYQRGSLPRPSMENSSWRRLRA